RHALVRCRSPMAREAGGVPQQGGRRLPTLFADRLDQGLLRTTPGRLATLDQLAALVGHRNDTDALVGAGAALDQPVAFQRGKRARDAGAVTPDAIPPNRVRLLMMISSLLPASTSIMSACVAVRRRFVLP